MLRGAAGGIVSAAVVWAAGKGVSEMLRRLIGVSLLLLAAGFPLRVEAATAAGKAAPAGVSGIFLTTQYPALTVRVGETATIDLALRNYRLPPQQLELSVPQAAPGWKATVLGGGQPIASAIVPPDSVDRLQLRLEPPAKSAPGEYRFVVAARGAAGNFELPIALTVGKELPAKLKLTTGLPALRGTASTSFKFTVTAANDSGRDANVDFSAAAPRNFQVTFAEAYGTQEITSLPIKAGQSKDIDATVALPHDTPAGDYHLVLHAKSEAAAADLPLSITLTGQPRLSLSGEGGRLSANAYAGQASPLTIVVRNTGSEAAHDIALDASAPEDWKTEFSPKALPEVAAGKSQSVQLTLTPSPRAIAGDYQATVTANSADGQSDSENFRITVLTSTLWGMVGIGVIAIALLVIVFAVARFGRR
jgi:uncharacterized membrane protein